jgi:hypothetical protein
VPQDSGGVVVHRHPHSPIPNPINLSFYRLTAYL